MDTNTVQIIEKFGNKVDSYIQTLAEKAGMTAEHFWPIFVQQQFNEGLSWLIFGAFLFIFGMILILCNRKKEFGIKSDCPTVRFFTTVMGCLVLLGFFMSCGTWITSLQQILNPEYFAVKSLVEMVK